MNVTLADALKTVPAIDAVGVLDLLHGSADSIVRRWAIDESRRLRNEITARERADVELRERRRQKARQHLSALRQMIGG